MDQVDDELNRSLEDLRLGRASLQELRSLATKLSNQHYSPGIPVLADLLNHADEIVRNNAVVSLGFDFHFTPIVGRLLTMLENDPDDDCRGSAAGALGNLCRDSKEAQVLNALGRAALNDLDEDVRLSAYKALLSVNGLSSEEHLRVLAAQELSIDPAHVRAIVGANVK